MEHSGTTASENPISSSSTPWSKRANGWADVPSSNPHPIAVYYSRPDRPHDYLICSACFFSEKYIFELGSGLPTGRRTRWLIRCLLENGVFGRYARRKYFVTKTLIEATREKPWKTRCIPMLNPPYKISPISVRLVGVSLRYDLILAVLLTTNAQHKTTTTNYFKAGLV